MIKNKFLFNNLFKTLRCFDRLDASTPFQQKPTEFPDCWEPIRGDVKGNIQKFTQS